MKLTNEEYELSVNKIIDICNWCKNNNISCKQCTDSYGACRRNIELLKYSDLINKHFDNSVRIEEGKMFKLFKNKPLKFEELKEGMWVWDNLNKEYIQIEWLDIEGESYKYLMAHNVPSNEYQRLYSNNRFYRREV